MYKVRYKNRDEVKLHQQHMEAVADLIQSSMTALREKYAKDRREMMPASAYLAERRKLAKEFRARIKPYGEKLNRILANLRVVNGYLTRTSKDDNPRLTI